MTRTTVVNPWQQVNDATRIRRLTDYQKISAVVWLIIVIIQIICVVTIIAGCWNVFAAITRFHSATAIGERRSEVPADFDSLIPPSALPDSASRREVVVIRFSHFE